MLCIRCQHPNSGPFRTCESCRDAVKEKRKAKIAQGLCGDGNCPNLLVPGRTLCVRHLERCKYANRRSRAGQKCVRSELNDYDAVL